MNHEKIEKYFSRGIESFMPHISIDCVVINFDNPDLKVLVQRVFDQDIWVLPGGHVFKDENLDEAAYRNLKYSGLTDLFLRQFKTFGKVDRLQLASTHNLENLKIPQEIFDWVTQRFVTVGYYALLNSRKVKIYPGLFSNESKWLDINTLDSLALDHAEIVMEARKVLSEDLLSFPVVANLLPEIFTLPELRKLYEAILNRPIDRGSFRRKIIRSGILDKVGKQSVSTRRPANIYRLNHPPQCPMTPLLRPVPELKTSGDWLIYREKVYHGQTDTPFGTPPTT